ncbi:MAG: hypothetical protein KBD83_09020, partial [Gammaproteobacteria bacterium]|nr:hypothetical protein [Gammaproteobacteria bacterium]
HPLNDWVALRFATKSLSTCLLWERFLFQILDLSPKFLNKNARFFKQQYTAIWVSCSYLLPKESKKNDRLEAIIWRFIAHSKTIK